MKKVKVERYPLFSNTPSLYVVVCPICDCECKVKPMGKDDACQHLKFIDDIDVAYFG